MQKDFQFLCASRFLHLPYGLGERVGSAPDGHPNRTIVFLIRQLDDQIAAGGAIGLTDETVSPRFAAQHGAVSQVLRTRPVTNFLMGFVRQKSRLIGAFQQVGQVLLIRVDEIMNDIRMLLAAAIAPAGGGHQPLDLEQIGMNQKPDHGFHVIGFHVGAGNVGQHHQTRLEGSRTGNHRTRDGKKQQQRQ